MMIARATMIIRWALSRVTAAARAMSRVFWVEREVSLSLTSGCPNQPPPTRLPSANQTPPSPPHARACARARAPVCQSPGALAAPSVTVTVSGHGCHTLWLSRLTGVIRGLDWPDPARALSRVTRISPRPLSHRSSESCPGLRSSVRLGDTVG